MMSLAVTEERAIARFTVAAVNFCAIAVSHIWPDRVFLPRGAERYGKTAKLIASGGCGQLELSFKILPSVGRHSFDLTYHLSYISEDPRPQVLVIWNTESWHRDHRYPNGPWHKKDAPGSFEGSDKQWKESR